MNKYFETLSENQYRELKDAMALITVLIAGADGEIDEDEKDWAKKVTDIRTYSGPEVWKAYYRDVGVDLDQRIHNLISALPSDTDERNKILSDKLTAINPILAKLDQAVGASMYDSFVSFAEHVAKASGGFMRMWSISKEEAKWVKLPMLTKIDAPEVDEEE